MNPETSLQNKIRLALSKMGILNFRNNTGTLLDRNGRPVRFGLCKGSADIIGLRTVTITEDMVGQKFGQFVAIEVKTKTGKVTEAQENFLDQVNRAGGFGMIVRSAGEVGEMFDIVT